MLLRKAGFFATIAAGMALLGAAFHGITGVDDELKLAAASPAPPAAPVNDRRCDKREGRHHRGGPEV